LSEGLGSAACGSDLIIASAFIFDHFGERKTVVNNYYSTLEIPVVISFGLMVHLRIMVFDARVYNVLIDRLCASRHHYKQTERIREKNGADVLPAKDRLPYVPDFPFPLVCAKRSSKRVESWNL
jgi:hypothetical protein